MKFISEYISKTYADYYINYLKNQNVLNVKSCFDIGSSTGSFVDELNKIGIDAEGIEKDGYKIQSKKVKNGSFDLNYTTDKKYDMITLPQVIYFLGDFEQVLKKLKGMLNPNGIIFIISMPKEHFDKGNPTTFTDIKTYPLHTKIQYEEICQRLGFRITDYSIIQSDIGVAFNDGKFKAVLRLFLFMTGLRKPVQKHQTPLGNHLYLLLKT